jgi:hypothetical protein
MPFILGQPHKDGSKIPLLWSSLGQTEGQVYVGHLKPRYAFQIARMLNEWPHAQSQLSSIKILALVGKSDALLRDQVLRVLRGEL